MKKSKVLIPAMALLLFSTAASVTSTVAWFTSTRVYNTTVSQFKVAKIDGNLECTMTGVVGTTAGTDNQGNPVMNLKTTENNVDYTTYLGDASLNYHTVSPSLWTDNPAGSGYVKIDDLNFTNGAFAPTAAANWLAYTDPTENSEAKYFYAAMWTMEFSYTFATIGGTANIFFDYNASTLTYASGSFNNDTTPGKDSIRGFRLAFLAPNTTGDTPAATKRLIWSPYDDGIKRVYAGTNEQGSDVWSTGEDANAYKYVSDESNLGQDVTAFVSAGNKAYITGTTAYARANDSTENQSTRRDYLAGIPEPEQANVHTNSVKITCVAWFEGTNSNIEDRTTMQALVADLKFYAAMNKPAAEPAGD